MKKLSVLLLFALMCSLFLMQSCKNEHDETTPLSKYSGEELFRAIYFTQGEAANHIQSLRHKVETFKSASIANSEMKKISEDLSNELVREINRLDPEYFLKFKEQLSSKNFYAMELALGNGAKMIRAAGYRTSYASMFKLVDDMNEKKVDLKVKELEGLDITKKEDFEKFQAYLKNEYSIDLQDTDYKVGVAVPIAVYAAAVVWTIAAVVASAVGVVNAAVYATVYMCVELAGNCANAPIIEEPENMIVELSKLL